MIDEQDIDQLLKKSELEKIESEIKRNNAERDHLKRSTWRSVTTCVVAAISGLVIVFQLSGFFVNLRTMLTTELGSKKQQIEELTNEKNNLITENKSLAEDNNALQDLRARLNSALAVNVTMEQKLAEIRSNLSEVYIHRRI
jgi:hypothetical protein